MVKPLPINNKIRGARRFAAPNSIYFRTWFAQQQRKDRKARSEIQPLLLDTYSGAAAAYSLRPLSTSTTSVIRVRRSSDNTEQDFTAKQITDGALVSFCGTGDGLVTTWYDQSGNGNDATQTTASDQPRIVTAGVLVTEDGFVSINSVGSNDALFASGLDISNFTVFSVAKAIGAATGWEIYGSSDRRIWSPADGMGFYENGDTLYTYTANTMGSHTTVYSTDTVSSFYNGSLAGSSSVSGVTNSYLLILLNDKSLGNEGSYLSELILYPSDQSANREAIEANIASYYGITLA